MLWLRNIVCISSPRRGNHNFFQPPIQLKCTCGVWTCTIKHIYKGCWNNNSYPFVQIAQWLERCYWIWQRLLGPYHDFHVVPGEWGLSSIPQPTVVVLHGSRSGLPTGHSPRLQTPSPAWLTATPDFLPNSSACLGLWPFPCSRLILVSASGCLLFLPRSSRCLVPTRCLTPPRCLYPTRCPNTRMPLHQDAPSSRECPVLLGIFLQYCS